MGVVESCATIPIILAWSPSVFFSAASVGATSADSTSPLSGFSLASDSAPGASAIVAAAAPAQALVYSATLTGVLLRSGASGGQRTVSS